MPRLILCYLIVTSLTLLQFSVPDLLFAESSSVGTFSSVVTTGPVKQKTSGSGNTQILNVGSATYTKAKSFSSVVNTGPITQSSQGSGIVQSANIGSATNSTVGTFSSTVNTSKIEQISTRSGDRQELELGSVTNSTVNGTMNVNVRVKNGITQTGSGTVAIGSVKDAKVNNFSNNVDVKKVSGNNIKIGSIVGQSKFDNEGRYAGEEQAGSGFTDNGFKMPSNFSAVQNYAGAAVKESVKEYVKLEVAATKVTVGMLQTAVGSIGSGGCGLVDLYFRTKSNLFYYPQFTQYLEYCNKWYGKIANHGFDIAWDGVNDLWGSDKDIEKSLFDLKKTVIDDNWKNVKESNDIALKEAVDGKPLAFGDYAMSVLDIFGGEIGAAAFKVIGYGGSRYVIYLTKTGKIQTVVELVNNVSKTGGKILTQKIDNIIEKELVSFFDKNPQLLVELKKINITTKMQELTDYNIIELLGTKNAVITKIENVTEHGFTAEEVAGFQEKLGEEYALTIRPPKEGRVSLSSLNQKDETLKNKTSDILDKYLSKELQKMGKEEFNEKVATTVVHYKPDIEEIKTLAAIGPPKVFKTTYKLSDKVEKIADYVAHTENLDLNKLREELLDRGIKRLQEYRTLLNPLDKPGKYTVNEYNQVILTKNGKAITSDLDAAVLLKDGKVVKDPKVIKQLKDSGLLQHKEFADWELKNLSEAFNRTEQINTFFEQGGYILDKNGLSKISYPSTK